MPNRIISVQRTPGKRLCDCTKPLLAVVISLVAMTALFFISLVAVSHIMKSSISQNALISAQTIDEEGLKRKIGGIPIFRLDNFTDALMINIATNIDERNSVESAMNCTYTYRGNRMSVTQGIRDAINEDYEHDAFEYARYWHGYLLFLRPLLTATDYSGIRILNYLLLSLLLGGIICLGIRRRMYGTIVAFITSLVAINFWMVPLSMQYSNTFYTVFAATIYILCTDRQPKNRTWLAALFCIIGGITAFTDLLTTPLLTLCIPLLFLLSKEKDLSTQNALKYTAICSTTWAVGYAGIWIAKWLLAAVLTGYDISDAAQQISVRTATEFMDVDMSLWGIASLIFAHKIIFFALATVSIAFISLTIWQYQRNPLLFKKYSYLLLIAAFPLFWFLAIRNHCVVHYWFVWRLSAITIFAYGLFLLRTRSNS